MASCPPSVQLSECTWLVRRSLPTATVTTFTTVLTAIATTIVTTAAAATTSATAAAAEFADTSPTSADF